VSMKIVRLIILILLLCFTKASISRARLVDNGNNTVTDNTRNLMWQKHPQGTFNWQTAINYCNELAFAGFDDWRLPHLKELYSLMDHEQTPHYIDQNLFTAIGEFWSSTANIRNVSDAWRINFTSGNVDTSPKVNSIMVMCIRQK
jgi:hypothetical protein